MRTLCLAALVSSAFFTTSSPASADQSETCNKQGFLAESAMLLRQFGAMDLGKALDSSKNEPELQEFLLSAWEHPLMLTKETKKIATDEFKSAAILACYRN